jgi:hypothetical protein
MGGANAAHHTKYSDIIDFPQSSTTSPSARVIINQERLVVFSAFIPLDENTGCK